LICIININNERYILVEKGEKHSTELTVQ